MATRIGAKLPYKVSKDSGAVCTDATITFYLANSSTLQEVFSDKELTITLGSTVSCDANGVVPDIWVSDAISIKAIIAGTGVTSDTIDYLTVAASTVAGTTSGDLALGNAIVNGGLSAWTPGTSYSNISGSGTGVEVADDIYFVQSTAASNAISRQTANGTQARYCMRVGRPASSTSTNKLRIWGTIPTDECYRLRGQEVTFSFRIKAGATFSGTALGVRIATGTTEAESGDLIEASGFAGHANPLNTTQAITTTATRYEFTCTLSATLKNLGWQLAYTGVGTAGATDYFEVEDLQIEIASAATAFKIAPEPLDFLRANLSAAGRTFIASPTSASLGGWLTDETGTGAVVFANTPTLISPLLGTPTSGVLTNCTGLPVSTGVSGLGTGVATFLATPSSANLIAAVTDETGTGSLVFATSPTFVTPLLGTPTSGTLTNCTGLPVSTGISGLAAGVAAWLAAPSSANLITAMTDEAGSGALYFTGGALGTPASGVLTNATGLPISTGVSGLGTGVATFLATPSSANLAAAVTDETGSGALVFATSPTLGGTIGGSPTASGVWTFTSSPRIESAAPTLVLKETDAGANEKTWYLDASAGVLQIQTVNDAENSTANVVTVSRSGTTVVTVNIAATNLQHNGTAVIISGGALGTPASGTLTSCTGLPISTGVSGLGANVATFLATPSSANLAAAVTDETGSTLLYFTGGALGTPASGNLSNCTALPVGSVTGLGTGVATFLATPSSANFAAAITDETGSSKVVFSAGTLDVVSGKTLTASNTLTLTATDGSTLAIGTGGTLGTAAYKATGTSGSTVPLLDGANAWSGVQTVLEGSGIVTSGGTITTGLKFLNTANDYQHTIDKDNTGVIFSTNSSARGFRWSINGASSMALSTAGDIQPTTITARAAISSETTGTLTSASSNRTVNATGGVTINDGVHTAGDRIEIYAGASARTITQDTGMTLRLDGTATTGNRTLAAYGRMSVYFETNAVAICSGAGVT